MNDYWLGQKVSTNNRDDPFNTEPVEVDEGQSSGSLSGPNKVQVAVAKAPPIFVGGVGYLSLLKVMLIEIAGDDYTVKILADNRVKVQLGKPECYLPLVEALKKKNAEYHTYQRKHDRNYKVFLREMHPPTNLQELESEIEGHDHKVMQINNIRHGMSKEPLPLFFVEIATAINNKQIYKITRLMHTVVTVEPPCKKRDIPQCLRCQEYGHTRNYCDKSPACVKCAKSQTVISRQCNCSTCAIYALCL